MRFKVGSVADDRSLGPVDFSGILNTYKNRGQRDFCKYVPAEAATGRFAQLSISTDDYEPDDTDELVNDRDFMLHFEAGVRDLNAGRRISADDLERELGL